LFFFFSPSMAAVPLEIGFNTTLIVPLLLPLAIGLPCVSPGFFYRLPFFSAKIFWWTPFSLPLLILIEICKQFVFFFFSFPPCDISSFRGLRSTLYLISRYFVFSSKWLLKNPLRPLTSSFADVTKPPSGVLCFPLFFSQVFP